MARLSEEEKQTLRAMRHVQPQKSEARTGESREPASPALTPREYVEFATFASRFDRSHKPVRFTGDQWKL